MSFSLAADIGGTKTILALYDDRQGFEVPVLEEEVQSRNYKDFTSLLRHFLADRDITVRRACLGVAGPVRENSVRLTNLPWQLKGSEIESEFSISRVMIINDLVALASAIPQIKAEDIHVLHKGFPDKKGAQGVVAPGTGLGMSFLISSERNFLVGASEGGHAGFSPANSMEVELLQYLLKKEKDSSFESLCSGAGLPSIHDFLAGNHTFAEKNIIKIQTELVVDATPFIIKGAMKKENPCPLCVASIRLFVQILAEACRTLALTIMASGGLYLAGGLPARILPFLQEPAFRQRFVQGKMADLLRNMPFSVVMTPRAGLIGAAAYMDSHSEF